MNEMKKNVLGRGLSSLLNPGTNEDHEDMIIRLPLDSIQKGALQPRKHFPEEDLKELAVSIQERGVLQPILVRLMSLGDKKYELIAGERRWRAAKIAGLDEIPVIVRSFSDGEALEIGLLENIQRQDLNPIEEAEGYHRLAEEFDHTQDSLSRILGKSRSHIANTLRLLTLPKTVQEHLVTGKLSAGHGRSLIGVENPEHIAEMIISRRLSVRQAEALAKQKEDKEENIYSVNSSDPEKEVLQNQLSDLLGTPVELILKGGGGKIGIPFKNPIELDTLIKKFNQLNSKEEDNEPMRIWS
ncbi:MAG: ParB/RepB/Spo0J family partition protein [Proteobacteria bacterium]|nr:ParB/RepB/Spo0J family partition protein [Pseudomonadota bacterium]